MEIVVTGRHTQVKQKFRDVVESKMNRVTAIAPDAQRAQIVLTHEGNPRQADTAKRVEITVIAGSTAPWCAPRLPAPMSSVLWTWRSTS